MSEAQKFCLKSEELVLSELVSELLSVYSRSTGAGSNCISKYKPSLITYLIVLGYSNLLSAQDDNALRQQQ
jgi:hypothetical protein